MNEEIKKEYRDELSKIFERFKQPEIDIASLMECISEDIPLPFSFREVVIDGQWSIQSYFAAVLDSQPILITFGNTEFKIDHRYTFYEITDILDRLIDEFHNLTNYLSFHCPDFKMPYVTTI